MVTTKLIFDEKTIAVFESVMMFIQPWNIIIDGEVYYVDAVEDIVCTVGHISNPGNLDTFERKVYLRKI